MRLLSYVNQIVFEWANPSNSPPTILLIHVWFSILKMGQNGLITKLFELNWSLCGGAVKRIQISQPLLSNYFLMARQHRDQFGSENFIEGSFCPILKMEDQMWIVKIVEGLFEEFARIWIYPRISIAEVLSLMTRIVSTLEGLILLIDVNKLISLCFAGAYAFNVPILVYYEVSAVLNWCLYCKKRNLEAVDLPIFRHSRALIVCFNLNCYQILNFP